jgi:hypothetical protein
MILNVVGGGPGGGGAVLNVLRVPTLPETVTNGRVVVISDVPALHFSFGYGLPSSPASGDIWVHVVDSGTYPIELDDGLSHVTITLGATMQYVSGAWAYRNAYVGVGGVWQMCSTLSPLSTLSWATIGAIAGSGEAMSQFFAVGDKKLVELTAAVLGTSSFEVEILDFLHDDFADGSGKAPITFGMVDCFATLQKMNQLNTNDGGWGSCELRSTLINTALPAMQTVIGSNVIKSVTKRTSAGKQSTTITTTTDTLFLLSEIEIFGATTYSLVGEGTQYPRFSTTASRIKKVDASASTWWGRSPHPTSDYNFCYTKADGTTHSYASGYAYGVACAFCV